MKIFRVIATLLLPLALVIYFSGCGGGGGNGGEGSINQSPVIDSLIVQPGSGFVDLEETSTLTVYASDPDGDQLEIVWDATAGTLDTIYGSTVVWTAPDEALPSMVITWVSDGVLTVDTSYSYDFSGFAPGAPSLDSVHATPWHIYSATAANPSLWFLDLFAKVANGSATSEVIRVTAVPPSGTVLNLRNDGVYPDSIANDDEWNGFPGSYTMVVDTGWVKFTATNQYYQSTEDSFHIDIICDSIPQVTSPDTLIGDIYGYASGVPQFYWLTYPGALYYQIAVSRMDYTYIWQPSAQLNDTTALYNFDNSATLIQLELFQDYILHLSVNKGNAWAKMEQVIRRVE